MFFMTTIGPLARNLPDNKLTARRVGKTSLMNQYVNKRFSNQYKATIGTLPLHEGGQLVLTIWYRSGLFDTGVGGGRSGGDDAGGLPELREP